MKIGNKNIPLPGLRNIKTALSVLVLLLAYEFTGRSNVSTAITASILCLQDSVSKSITESRDRVISTIAGGLYGLFFVYFWIGKNEIVYNIGISLSIVLAIYVCNLLKQRDLILNTMFVLIAVAMVPRDEMLPMTYAANRIIDTLIGIFVALIINRYFFPPKTQRLSYKRTLGTIEQLKKDCLYIKPANYKKTTWAGGDALEVLIHPKNSLYEEYDFKYRVSIAETIGDLTLSLTPNYNRRTMILEGETTFIHEGYHTIKLKQFDQDYFKGNVKTLSKGRTVNFNVMLSKGYESDVATVQNNEHFDLVNITNDQLDVYNVALFYSLYDNNVLTITKDGVVVFNHIINKGESIVFKHLNNYAIDEYLVTLKNKIVDNDAVICIRADIKHKPKIEKKY